VIQRSSQVIDFIPSMGNQNRDACYDRPAHDIATIYMTDPLAEAASKMLAVAIRRGDGAALQNVANGLAFLGHLAPTASAEMRLAAAIGALAGAVVPRGDATPTPEPTQSPTPTPTPAREAKARDNQPDRPTRQSKASTPRMDASGKLLASKEIGGVAVVSQAEARKALGVSCVQMLRLEGQRALTRIQESGSRLVWYSTSEVQRLIDLLDATPPQPL
jgi:hypothetical protein